MATGVLVLLVGEATKLSPYLTAHDKEYLAEIAFGRGTTSLDADGSTTDEREVPPDLRADLDRLERGEALADDARLARALQAERARTEQAPPKVSAISVGGKRSHERTRAGEEFDLPARAVSVSSLEVAGATSDPHRLRLSLAVSKGYYVRSLARDLAAALGTAGHLSALRRTRSGPFSLADAAPLDAELDGHLIALEAAARRALAAAILTDGGAAHARAGRNLSAGDFTGPPPSGVAAWFDAAGALIAIGEPTGEGRHRVLRGFRPPRAPSP
jgi:tRNA pseudouridine55 synthase